VRVQLASGSAALGRIATARLRVGDELDVPLAMVDGTVEFLLRATWIERSEVWFAERGERGRIHTLSLPAFLDRK
jgi:hypothetical protein